MIKLLKLEAQRKWKTSLGILAMFVIVYFGFLIKFNNDIKETVSSMNMMNFDLNLLVETFGFRFIFFILLGSGLFFISVVGAINNLRIEAKQPTRDLYFTIPMTAYTKIGSKVIASLVEIGVASFVAFASVINAFEFLTKKDVWPKVMDALKELPTGELTYLIIYNIIMATMMIVVVYLSFAIFRSFFSQVKFGGFITIVIYVILNYLIFKFFGGVVSSFDNTTFNETTMWLLLAGFGAFTGLLFVLVGYLFEKRVSFD